jgi:drug/metabolite transporter (DMT)-like permease
MDEVTVLLDKADAQRSYALVAGTYTLIFGAMLASLIFAPADAATPQSGSFLWILALLVLSLATAGCGYLATIRARESDAYRSKARELDELNES